ncbi:hypothetical protein F7725_025166 [Dissostichus mawsoni]|uniref:Uncharacterized protein n=1 Tax=Dissostichus mawsoni TaxID=36200 RepID=A0A7J5XAE0_DISMA|nr:hypothetical protein F7725_025166 [Dissostichus mawsoni]
MSVPSDILQTLLPKRPKQKHYAERHGGNKADSLALTVENCHREVPATTDFCLWAKDSYNSVGNCLCFGVDISRIVYYTVDVFGCINVHLIYEAGIWSAATPTDCDSIFTRDKVLTEQKISLFEDYCSGTNCWLARLLTKTLLYTRSSACVCVMRGCETASCLSVLSADRDGEGQTCVSMAMSGCSPSPCVGKENMTDT